MTPCNQDSLLFQGLASGNSRKVEADFGGGHLSGEGGLSLIAELDRRLGFTERFGACFRDGRDPLFVEHSLTDLLRQRVFGLCQGYEDLNDHDRLRRDPLLAACVGKDDVLGRGRSGKGREGFPLAGKSTLNRLETGTGRSDPYHKIVPDPVAIEDFFIEAGLRCLPESTREIVIDFDSTDDLVHGEQQERFYHGFYGNWCYLPLYAFCGDIPLVAKLRPANIDGCAGTVDCLAKIVLAARARFGAEVRVIMRADSGFCRDSIMTWCEDNGVFYCLGLARNKRLQQLLDPTMDKAKAMACLGGGYATFFTEFEYRTLDSWTRERRVIGKAQVMPKGINPRFIVTNLPAGGFPGEDRFRFEPETLYRNLYCGRGDMENRIKEQQLDLFADRTSTHWMASNQLRLWFSTLAYLLVAQLRARALHGTELARATVGTIRQRLLKIATAVKVSVRRVLFSMASAFPLQELFATAHSRIAGQERLS